LAQVTSADSQHRGACAWYSQCQPQQHPLPQYRFQQHPLPQYRFQQHPLPQYRPSNTRHPRYQPPTTRFTERLQYQSSSRQSPWC